MARLQVMENFKGRTGYHIFVDRYQRSGKELPYVEGRKVKVWNDAMPDWWPDQDGEYRNRYFYGGDLQGITEKLDYIAELGVDLLFLSPISQTMDNHHYDVGDQTVLDPYIGTWEDFSNLCVEAHKRNMVVIVDLVYNHMGSYSEFFQKALQGVEPYKSWFEWDERGNPVYWFGFKTMSQTNKQNAGFQDFAKKETEKYIKHGADGVRYDLGEIFPSEFLKSQQSVLQEENKEILTVSEMWDFAIHRENPQIYDGQVNSLMNYPQADAILRWVRYGNYLHFNACMNFLAKYPVEVHDVLWNHLDTHDTPRAITMLAGEGMLQEPFAGRIWDIEGPWRTNRGFDTYGFRKWEAEHDNVLHGNAMAMLKIAAFIQYLMKGIPILFYGTEVGVAGYKDPFNRKTYPWQQENKDLRQFYIGLGAMRKKNMDILAGGDQFTYADGKILEITRRSNQGIITAYINRTSEQQKIYAPYVNTVGAKQIFQINGGNEHFLPPYGAVAFRF